MIRIGVTGLIAYEAALRLVREHREELENRFCSRFIRAFDELAQIMPEPDTAALQHVSSGGLFGTIWRALDTLEKSVPSPGQDSALPGSAFEIKPPAGCRIDLDRIPVRQEITEICELYDENPYEADSAGAYLVIWDEDSGTDGMACFHLGDASKDRYAVNIPENEIAAIGCVVRSKDRLIINNDMIRYLTPYSRQMTDISARKNDRRP